MLYRKSRCPVDPPEKDLLGVYANSLRLTNDGADVLLDFCLYSESEDRAQVKSRVRVSPDFLRVILSKIQDSLLTSEDPRQDLRYPRKPLVEA